MKYSVALITAYAAYAYGANNNGGTGTASGAGAAQTVLVAQNNGLTFTPNTVQAAVGSSVVYQFTNGNHTVTAGTMTAGCQPGGQGFASGFVAVNNNPTNPKTINGNLQGNAFLVKGTQLQQQQQQQAKNGNNKRDDWAMGGIWGRAANGNPTFTVQVASANPQPVYCNQQLHCQQGPMVMMINGNAQQLAQYQQLAKQAQANVIANGPTGGTLAGKTQNNNNQGNNQAAQQAQQQAQQQQQQAQQQQQQQQAQQQQQQQQAQQAKNNN